MSDKTDDSGADARENSMNSLQRPLPSSGVAFLEFSGHFFQEGPGLCRANASKFGVVGEG
jgi:hypothetical protein